MSRSVPDSAAVTIGKPRAFSPLTGLYYFGSADGCHIFTRNDREYVEGAQHQLSNFENIPGDPPKGSIVAVDPNTGDVRWRYEMIRHPSGGAMATAGGLVFIGDYHGYFLALDAKSGKVLWRFQTGAGIFAAYTFEGKQYVVVAAGTAVMAFALP